MLRLPAEWEPQEAVYFVWPRDPLTWPDRLDAARAVFVQACQAVPEAILLAHPESAPGARQALAAAGLENSVVEVVHQDSWIRDYGALTVHQGAKRVAKKFTFDAWGGKYESLIADNGVMARLDWPAAVEEVDFVLEGGAVETDGQGTFLATESVAKGRGQSLEEHEAALRTHLGARHIIWLGDGIRGDDTDGHIDTITRFVGPATVVTTVAPPGHPDHDALADNLARLQRATDASGRPLAVHTLPVPAQQTTTAGEPLPAGYANFLITNHAVLVPVYGCSHDLEVEEIMAGLFPDRLIATLDHRDLIWGFGGIHCLSMQVAAPPA